ncbi:chemotaxis protein CheD [Candidatus Auribacterota bacterium]
MKHTVDIADMKVSKSNEDIIITHALGSCLGVSIYEPNNCLGGMIHCMLPLSKADPNQARNNPYKFTDTGITLFLQKLFNMGAKKANLIVKVAGCAQIFDDNKFFNIGERNYTVLRKILWKNDILISAEETGDTKPRTMALYMETGKTTIKSRGEETEL